MRQARERFVEPEIVKHEEKVADVTAQVGYRDDDDTSFPDGTPD